MFSVSLVVCRFRDPPILQAHNNSDIILRLPMGKRIRDIRWLSVWCRRFTVSVLAKGRLSPDRCGYFAVIATIRRALGSFSDSVDSVAYIRHVHHRPLSIERCYRDNEQTAAASILSALTIDGLSEIARM